MKPTESKRGNEDLVALEKKRKQKTNTEPIRLIVLVDIVCSPVLSVQSGCQK